VDKILNLADKSVYKNNETEDSARDTAVKNALENNETARAVSGAPRPKAASPAVSGGGPIRTNSFPAPVKSKPEDHPIDITVPAPEMPQKQELAA
jgi:tRNA-dihydrouridine synthase 2